MASAKQVLEFVIKAIQTKPTLSTIAKESQQNIKKAQEQTISLKKALKTLDVTPVATLKKKTEEMERAFDRLTAAYKKGEITAKDYAVAQANLKAKMQELQGSTKTLSGTFSQIKNHLLGLAAASYSLVKLFGVYSAFETRMAEVNTLLNTSQENLNNLRRSILDLTTQIPQSASQLASAEYDIISAGVKLKDSVEVLKLSAKAAIAGLTDTKTAAKVGVSVINAYGMSIDQLGDVYDTLFMTVKQGVTTFPELAQYIGKVLPVAKSANVNFRDLSAAIATLTKVGIKTPEAIEYLRGALTALASPGVEAKKVMDELGITWKGLIPTIKELAKYADQPELMRKLIPDVGARTAVLALAGNFKTLTDTVGVFQNRAGAMPEAYNKMKDTPENKLRMFQNQIERLGISIGEFIANALLPVVTQINKFIQAVEQVDGPTRAYIKTLIGAGAAFALWKAGLGSIVTGLGSLIVQLHTTIPLTTLFTTKLTLAKAAMLGVFGVTTALAVHNVLKLANEMKSLNDVMKENQSLANHYKAQAENYKEAANVQILSQKEILNLTEEQRKAYKRELIEAMKYYTYKANAAEMEATQAKKILGIPLPFQTEKAKEAQKNAEKYQATLQNIVKALHQVRDVGHTSVLGVSRSMQALHPVYLLSIADAQALGKELQKAYKDASKAAEEWKNKVIMYQELIRRENQSTEELIRSLRRKTMSEEEAWYDRRREAEENLAKAEQALHEGNFELAKEYAEKAKRQYADLSTTVYKTTEDGHKEVVINLKDATETAVSGIQQASGVITKILKEEKKHAQDMKTDYEEKIKTIQKLMSELTKPEKKDITLNVNNYNEIKTELDKLAIPITKYIHVKYVQEEAPGAEKHASGGKIAGYGGGDIVPALLEPGEFVVKKEATKEYLSLLYAINNLRLPKIIQHFSEGGVVVPYTLGMGFMGPGEKEAKFSWPVNLLGDKLSEARKVYSKLKTAMDAAWRTLGGWHQPFMGIDGFYRQFVKWWEKQRELHKDEIARALEGVETEEKVPGPYTYIAPTKEKTESETPKSMVDLNILLGDRTFSVKAEKSVVDRLLAEIEKLKALGYA